jgi:hypothetical protein
MNIFENQTFKKIPQKSNFMNSKNKQGWQKFTENFPWFKKENGFPLPAYSEFMPAPKVGISQLGDIDYNIFSDKDPFGWKISEHEEEIDLRPGIEEIGKHVMKHIINFGKGEHEHAIYGHGGKNIKGNPYWPENLAQKAGKLKHEKFVAFLSCMLSRTQDDKGRTSWTFFGSSIHGSEIAFWKSFYTAPDKQMSDKESENVILEILAKAYEEKVGTKSRLKDFNFAILPTEKYTDLPDWTKPYVEDSKSKFEKTKYLLTFRPFSELSEIIQQKYFAGELNLLPFPGSLVFWGMPTFNTLAKEIPTASQIPLLRLVGRKRGSGTGLRVQQSGWFLEKNGHNSSDINHELLREKFQRTHRWERSHRFVSELEKESEEMSHVAKVLFSTNLDSMGLYDKPMARNSQIWTQDFKKVLDGPNDSVEELRKAEIRVMEGGLYGYRFFYPPMKTGEYSVYLQRPIITFIDPKTKETDVISDTLHGYITAYHDSDKKMENPLELHPRIQKRKLYLSAIHDFYTKKDHHFRQTTYNLLSLLETWEMLGQKPLPRSFALRLMHLSKDITLEKWLEELPLHSSDEKAGKEMKSEIEKMIEPEYAPLPKPITFSETAKRDFELNWWNTIKYFAHGEFVNKDNADCVTDDVTKQHEKDHHRHLEKLGDVLIQRHEDEIRKAGMEGKALAGELPFVWKTDFDYPRFGGWVLNQEKKTYERNILVVIPGKNRKQAVVMADHYDTAYMEDVYDEADGGSGSRISANGADDNFSATSTILLAAKIYLKLAKEGKLERDIWLLHLTGEEFPSDCMGARNFCQNIVQNTLKLHTKKGTHDLKDVEIAGTFIMDMIGHNKETDRDLFQIATGKSVNSLKIAYQAHLAAMNWNKIATELNKTDERKHLKRGERVTDVTKIPEIAKHLKVEGDVRNYLDPHSSIFNTDGMILSDIGATVVLFMENYDISRKGYHDQHDTLENIDLDYGAAVAAICIETVAQTAMQI